MCHASHKHHDWPKVRIGRRSHLERNRRATRLLDLVGDISQCMEPFRLKYNNYRVCSPEPPQLVWLPCLRFPSAIGVGETQDTSITC